MDRRDDPNRTIAALPASIQEADAGETIVGNSLRGFSHVSVASTATIQRPAPEVEASAQTIARDDPDDDTLVAGPGAGSTESSDPTPPLDAPGFEVEGELGRGGMGIVLRARQVSLDRPIALKTMRDGLPERARQAFIGEAMVMGHLDHPNILPVHDLGHSADDRPFVAMKVVRGQAWDQLLAQGPRTEDDLPRQLEVLLKVCDGIAYAHANGFIHRDLKPANILVGSFGEVLVTDWGLALEYQDEGDETPGKTEHRRDSISLVGTPAYMPPEMAKARNQEVGPWSDVYLLGAILYELLTGSPPHLAPDARSSLLRAIGGEIEPPRVRAPNRPMPQELIGIALKALDPDPARRPQDAGAFKVLLQDYQEHAAASRLLDRAQEVIDDLAAPGRVPRDRRYDAYEEALNRLEQALSIWPESLTARDLRLQTLLIMAEEALEEGDRGVARTQLGRLRGITGVDPVRLRRIEAGVRAQGSAWWRVPVAILMLILIWFAARHAQAPSASELVAAKVARQEQVFDRACHLMWDRLHAGFSVELPDVDRLLEELGMIHENEPEVTERVRHIGERALGLLIASAVADWEHGRLWRRAPELLAVLLRVDHTLEQRWQELRQFPGLKGTALGEDLRASRDLIDAKSHEELPLLLSRALQRGLSPTEARIVRDVLLQGLYTKRFRHRETLRRFMLIAAAMLERAITVRAFGYVEEEHAFSVTSIPFGAAAAPPEWGERVRVERVGGDWLALGPTGVPLWRNHLVEEDPWTGPAVPVADGSWVVASGNRLIRLDGATGTVVAGVHLDGRVVSIFPDPGDRRVLLVLVDDGSRRGFTHLVAFEDGQFDRPSSSVPGAHLRFSYQPLQKWLEAAGITDEPPILLEGTAGPSPALVRLTAAWERDPFNPELAVAIWSRLREGSPEGVENLLQGTDPAVTTMPWFQRIALALGLERAGAIELADQHFTAARASFLEAGGNPALAPRLESTPIAMIREVARDHLRSGREGRALELIDRARWFSNFVEGDHNFYMSAHHWAKGRRPDLAPRFKSLAERAIPGGGLLFLSPLIILVTDLFLIVLLLIPLGLVLVFVRLYLDWNGARLRDLRNVGLRTFRDRWITLLTHPIDRFRYHTLNYMRRRERLLVFLGSSAFLVSAAVVMENVRSIGQVAQVPRSVGTGFAKNPELMRILQREYAQGVRTRALARLLAESLYTADRLEEAKQILMEAHERKPQDSWYQVNLGVLAERGGARDRAAELYAQAVRSGGEGVPVAAWNLRRLQGQPPGPVPDEMDVTRENRFAMTHSGADRPLWCRARFANLRDLLSRKRAIPKRIIRAIIGMGLGRSELFHEMSHSSSGSTTGAQIRAISFQLLQLFFIGLAALALIWVPLPVRSRELSEGDGTYTDSSAFDLDRSWRQNRGRLGAKLGYVLPGAWDAIRGHVILGAFTLFGLAIVLGVRLTIIHGGPLSHVIAAAHGLDFFPGIRLSAAFPVLQPVADIAGTFLGIVFVLNLPFTFMRNRWSREPEADEATGS